MIRKEYTLRNGVSIPAVGFGTWQIPPGEEAYQATLTALKVGYRHIDTAAAYGNEASIGQAIRDSGIPRDQIFITSKLKAELKGYQTALDEYQKTIDRLGIDVLDLYLIHAPKPWHIHSDGLEYTEQNIETWKAFVELYKQGRVRAIGVSNFGVKHLRPLIQATDFPPHADQIYLCPGTPQNETVEYAKPYGILIEAYSPFATGRLFKVEAFRQLAAKYNVTPAQLAVRWSLQKGHLPLPKSVTPERIANNLDAYGFEITATDVETIDNIQIPW